MERTKFPDQKGQIQVLSALVGRMALAARMGYQYGGDRNIYQALGYPQEEGIDYASYAAKYARQDIAKAIINRPVQYTWKGPIRLREIGTEGSAIEKEWIELDKRLRLRSQFVRLDKLSSIGRYGALLLGFDDVSNREGFAQPVTDGNRKLVYLRPLGEAHAKIDKLVNNTRDPRYGLPEQYEIEYTEIDSNTTVSLKAHHSRVIHVTLELLESDIYGVPVLESVWNRLLDLEKLVGGSAEMFWRGARPGYQGKVKEDYTLPPDVEETLRAQFNEYEHNLRRFLSVEGVDIEALATQYADPLNHVDIQIQMISAVTGIPKRILVGSERGELSSAQDIVSWYSYVQTRREEHAEVNILRPFVKRCMEYGVLPKSEEYIVEWSDLFASSEKDKAEIGRVRAMAVREYSQNPIATELIPPKAFYKLFLGLKPEEVEELDELTDEQVMEEIRSIARGEGTMPDNTREVAGEPVQANGGE